jgi:hypothetical protein
MSKIYKTEPSGILYFNCPGCNEQHPVYVEGIYKPSFSSAPIKSYWNWNGDMDNPTFNPSLLVNWVDRKTNKNMVCHSFIKDGMIQFLSDCTHELVNQTVELLEL